MANTQPYQVREWVEQYTDDLLRWARYRTSSLQEAEDLVQETFVVAVNSADKFQGKSSPKTWLFSILNNKIADYHRKKFKEKKVNESSMGDDEEGASLEEFFDEGGDWKKGYQPGPWDFQEEENLLDNHEFISVFEDCMQDLPEKWYHCIKLKYIQKKKGKEVCQELDITESNYWQMVHRAKLKLRKCLEGNWFKT